MQPLGRIGIPRNILPGRGIQYGKVVWQDNDCGVLYPVGKEGLLFKKIRRRVLVKNAPRFYSAEPECQKRVRRFAGHERRYIKTRSHIILLSL